MNAAPSDRIGPYRLDGVLGRGGMGVVYEARHETTGDTVALKTVVIPKERSFAGLRREIDALRRLAHPGIVRVLDVGEHGGSPWYAMELLEGRTLRSVSRPPPAAADVGKPYVPGTASWWTESLHPGSRAATVPPEGIEALATTEEPAPEGASFVVPNLARVLAILRRVCGALAYLHGEGLVHRDLKPENILVRDDGTPVLVDFGLSVAWSGRSARETLREVADIAGTVAYMAPEQVGGDAVDARGPLLLGCILYEVLTGRPPFFGASPVEVLAKHLSVPPTRPSELVPGIPSGIEELTMRLLEKRPGDRLGFADLVGARLDELGVRAAPEPPAKPYLYRPGFWGRDEIMARLQKEIALLKEKAGKVVLLSGESGAGKTRLAMAFLREAQSAHVPALTGECVAPSRPGSTEEEIARPPLHPLSGVLRHIVDRCRERGADETERLLGRRRATLAAYEPALADVPGPPLQATPPLPPDTARLRLFADLLETLRALSAGRPLVLILDDLQWADGLTLGFLELCAKGASLRRTPLLLLGTYRVEETVPAIERIRADPRVLSLPLPRLDDRSLAQMGASMLATAVSSEEGAFLDHFARRAEGNPFFVAEFLRMALAEGLLARRADGRWRVAGERFAKLALPGGLQELVGRRLALLPQAARAIAQIASVLGRDVEQDLLARLSGWPTTTLLESLTDLVARQVLDETEEGRFRFVHDKVREAGYDSIAAAHRRDLHERAAAAITASSAPATRLSEIGHHWERAGLAPRACECYLPAARQAVDTFAYEEAERLFRAYLALHPARTAEAVKVRNELALKVLHIQGRVAESRAEHEVALAHSREIGFVAGEARAAHAIAGIEADAGRVDEGRALFGAALVLARRSGDRYLEAQILGSLGAIDRVQGRLDDATVVYHESCRIAREIGARDLEAIALGDLAGVELRQNRLASARSNLENAIATHRELGDRRHVGICLSNMAILTDGGRSEQQRLWEESLAIAREVGDRHLHASVLTNLAMIAPDRRVARRLYEEALAIARDIDDAGTQASVLRNVAELLEGPEAIAMNEEALVLARAIKDRHGQAVILGNLALDHFAAGRASVARGLLEEAMALHRSIGDRRWEARILIDLAALERRDGHTAEAIDRLRQAEDALSSLDSEAATERARIAVESGHIALIEGGDARAHLHRAKRYAKDSVRSAIDALLAAMAHAERGGRLEQGEVPGRPPALRTRRRIET
ncbi:MAG: tetratricopeptide repeat protein [Acidobacteriota bacterium]